MKNIFTIFKRELNSYLNSGFACIYLIVFIAMNNGLFMTRFFLIGRSDMRVFFDNLPFMLFIFIPVISMRLWAEEKKENTFELLMTFPMKAQELVLGKFLASLAFYSLALLCTLPIPAVIFMSGSPEPGVIISGYLGSLIAGTLFLSIGIFISGLTQEQIVAFVLTTLSCFFIFFIGTDFFASFIDGWISGLGSFMKTYLGAASHLISFSKGVVDFKDILYFVLASAGFLFLNGLSFEGRLRPKARIVFSSAVAICLAGIVLVNWLIYDIHIGRFDLTENKIYTTSETARKILSGLKSPLTVNLYISPQEKMPTALKTLEQDIVDKLSELKIISSGKLSFKTYHIEASNLIADSQNPQDTGERPENREKILKDKGIVPFQVESIDKDEFGLKLVYSAISITYKEKGEEILPRIFPANLPDLEYLLFSRIIKLTLNEKPKIALFSALKTQETAPGLNQLLERMGQQNQTQYEDEYQNIVPLIRNNGYSSERIALTKDNLIPKETKTLLILNPGALNDRQLYEINKFLYQGGNALIAAQGFEYSFQTTPASGLEITPKKLSLDINKLLEKWGVKINEDILMDEDSQTIEVSSGQKIGPFALSMPIKLPNQILVKDSALNKNISLMNRLPSLFYLWGSYLETSDDIIKQIGLKNSLMFGSSPKSWKIASEGGTLKKKDLSLPKGSPEGKLPLAVMLEGQFTDTFSQAVKPEWPTKETPANQDKTAAKKESMTEPRPGKLIIIGCAKMFTDQLLSNPGNLGLLANIIDGLTLGDDIIQIRAKSSASRELKKTTNSQKVLYKFIAILLMPILLVGYSSIRLLLRRKEKQIYLQALEK